MQHVHLDVLGEDTEGYLDGPGGTRRIKQGTEDRLADLAITILGQGGLSQAPAHEITDVRDRRGTRRKDLEEHDDRHDLDRFPTGTVNGLGHRIAPQSRTQRAMAHVWAEARLFDSGHHRKRNGGGARTTASAA